MVVGAAGGEEEHSFFRLSRTLIAVAVLLGVTGCSGSAPVGGSAVRPPGTSAVTGQSAAGNPSASAATGAQRAAVPEPAHTVVVVMENHSYADITANSDAPFINDLARRGALFTRSYAITHPSEPNYLALFSGSTQGIADDGCPYRFDAPNLAADLIKAGKTFAGYADLRGPDGTARPLRRAGHPLHRPGHHRGRVRAAA